MIFHERWHRSAIKSVSYRVLHVSVDIMVAYFFTRDAKLTIGIVTLVNGYSTVLYYLHERLWNRIHIGKESGDTPVDVQRIP